MGIFLMIIGGIGLLVGLSIFSSCQLITKNKENWDEFYERFLDETSYNTPEEAIYNIVLKLKIISGIAILVSMCFIALGASTFIK